MVQRIEKYTKAYQRILPYAQILLIQVSIPDMTIRSYSQQRLRLKPPIDAISSLTDGFGAPNSSVQGDVVLHMFSHSGSNITIQLALSMRRATISFLYGLLSLTLPQEHNPSKCRTMRGLYHCPIIQFADFWAA